MRIGIIGCGLIGRKRALSLEEDDKLISCCDTNVEIGEKFAKEFNCYFFNDYEKLLNSIKLDIVIISVINKYAKDIVNLSLKKNIHILLEKPMGRNYDESLEMYENSLKSKSIFKIGFNHRFHPSLWDVKKFLSYNTIGEIMYIKASYGHGGRPGMENEWRSSKDLCGGGELLDQGVHLIDLTNWFIGEFNSVYASISTKFWNINVEDNAFIHLTKNNIDIQLHVSWTNWKNSFNYEIYGTKGYLKVNGLGGSYGKETLEIGERKSEGGIPNITKIEYDKDNSWLLEWQNLKNNIKNNIDLIGNHIDGLYANKIINHLYESSIKKEIIKL